MNKQLLKPFNLEAAQKGDPVWMEPGASAWAFEGDVHFVGVTEQNVPVVQFKGAADQGPRRVAAEYLRMKPRKRTVYVNVYETRIASKKGFDSAAFDAERDAIENARVNALKVIATAQPVEIEE